MKLISITAVCACSMLLTPTALANPDHAKMDHHAQSEQDTDKPVNAMCPIGNEPIEEEGGTYEYKGNTIGFCCRDCVDKFAAWDEAKKDEFVAMSMMKTQPDEHAEHDDHDGDDDHHEMMNADPLADSTIPYILNTCPISGEELGEMGDPIVKVYDGREVKFCCKMCVPDFEKDLKASFKNLDQQIIDSQLPFYPMTTCPVSGEELGGEDGMGEPINFVYKNRLIRFCCRMCKGDFKKDPEAYIAKLDAAVIAQQSEHYPLTTCPISGEELDGESVDIVYAGRLVKLCCKKCVAKFKADPTPTIEKIDAGWMAMHKKDADSDHDAMDGHHGG